PTRSCWATCARRGRTSGAAGRWTWSSGRSDGHRPPRSEGAHTACSWLWGDKSSVGQSFAAAERLTSEAGDGPQGRRWTGPPRAGTLAVVTGRRAPVTDAQWLACDDAERMLALLRGKASDRKLRLFACACGRRVLHFMKDERGRTAIEVGERLADGV